MHLIWGDECTGSAGQLPAQWDVRETDQWQPANELQRYTRSPSNVAYNGQGQLVITARKDDVLGGTFPYTSGKISTPRTTGSFLWLGGMVETRIKLPLGVGCWPAFWMVGQDSVYGWPACGELDVMEAPVMAGKPRQIHQGTHSPGPTNQDVPMGVTPTLAGQGDWHTYSARWEYGQIDFFVDSLRTGQITRSMVEAAGGRWVFDHHPMYLILNLAVGGWAGAPDPSWSEQSMSVDYVRVYGN